MHLMVSFWQLGLVLIILLLVFGPSRIEGIGSSLGKAIRGFKKGINEEEDKAKKAKKVTSVEDDDSEEDLKS